MTERALTGVGRSELLAIIARQREEIATLREGLTLKGWFCPRCAVFNGEEKEILSRCRCCEESRA